jgi:fructuronate reductase
MGARIINESNLHALPPDIAIPRYDRGATRIGIVHIGPGAFHRAHQASYVDALLHADSRWAISAVSLRSAAVRDALAPHPRNGRRRTRERTIRRSTGDADRASLAM